MNEATTQQPAELPKLPRMPRISANLRQHIEMALAEDLAPIVVTDAEEARELAAQLKNVSDSARFLEEERKRFTRPIADVKKRIDAYFNTPKDRLTRRATVLKAAIGAWDRKVAEAARRAEEEARRRAEEAERKAQAEADAIREAAEAEAAELEERARQANDPDVRETLAHQADEARAQGNAEAMVTETAAVTVTTPVAPARASDGLRRTTRHAAVITDPMALLQAIIDGQVPIDVVAFKTDWLQAQARAQKGALSIPGVQYVAERGISA